MASAALPGSVEFEPIGYLTSGAPVWPVRGAEGDDDDDSDGEGIDTGAGGDGDDDDDSDDDDDDGKGKKGDDAGKGKKYVAPTEDEWRRTQAALTRANGDAKRHRLRVRELSKPKEGETDAAKTATDAAEKRYKPVAIRSAAKAAFLEAGLNDASPERVKKLLRMVDLDEVDVDGDGDVTGLDEQIESVKDDYPELFKPAEQPRKRATRLDASNRQTGGTDKPSSTGEKIAAALFAGGK